MVGVRGGAAELPCGFRGNAIVPHQLGDGVDTAVVAAGHQLSVDAWTAVTALDLGVDGADRHHEGVPSLLPSAAGALPPSVVAGGGNLQYLAEPPHGPLVLVFLDEAVGHGASLAKNADAFFKMSRSASSRLFSARRRRFSSSKGESFP